MKTPICLVIAPSGFLLDERVFMSLGILRVAAVLEQRGIPVEYVNVKKNPDDLDRMLSDAVSGIAQLRTEARRGHLASLAHQARDLHDVAKRLDRFQKAHQ